MGLFDDTLGCMLMATVLNIWLFGFVSYQYGVYFRSRYDDRLPLKVSGFGNLAGLNNFGRLMGRIVLDVLWALPSVVLFVTASSGLTHLFFSWRIYRLTRNFYILGMLVTIQLATLALGFVTGVRSVQVTQFTDYPSVSTILTVWLAMQTATDITISILLIWIFSVSRTAFAPTNAVLKRLIRGALQTGVISAMLSLGYLLGFALAPNLLVWQVFAYCSVRIYPITLMDTLVCRAELKEKLNGSNRDSGNNNNNNNNNNRERDREAFQLQPSVSQGVIRIHTQIQQETDMDPSMLDRKTRARAQADAIGSQFPDMI
ncbi:hypothetical protein K435DRAFT_915878 [Dendrothele bispora CBS 962.96]|uniref:DUF6534 domain-containing protein n=1 Tax=Dendrothele bispora (strain CBS 962.96) TaxID=1314807 RepID=A0A4S8LIM2_DENBC|nr:hypothetical protein K435DRAFT_915878 [Dendrothele bispora CBS 962.96]